MRLENGANLLTTDQLASELLHVATTLARQAGDMALEGRRKGLENVQTKSTATDMVTEFDKASEVLIVQGLAKTRPDDAIIGEEGASHSGTSGITWHIDPIDGTTNFFYDLPTWAVSIGAVDEHGSLAGAVYIPALNEMFTAVRGGGAFCNDEPIRCNPLGDISKALVCTGFSYAAEQRTVQATRVSKFIHQVRDIRRFGAASIDICFVACGRFDAYFEENLHSWDFAAGELIAREAGCQTGDFAGNALRPAQVLVANPQIFSQLSALILASSTSDR